MKLHRRLRVSTLVLVRASRAALVRAHRARSPNVVVYASGTDLESGNPLVTVHSLSRQIQRFALFVTLAQYDPALAPVPYAARRWEWSPDRRTLVLHLDPNLRWHDGSPTTARDVAFTIDAARDPATGYLARRRISGRIDSVVARDDSTAALHFRSPQADVSARALRAADSARRICSDPSRTAR